MLNQKIIISPLLELRLVLPVVLVADVLVRACAEHFRQSGPNGLESEKETTPGIVRS